MSQHDESDTEEIKVNDRRRFSPDGTPLDSAEPGNPPPSASNPAVEKNETLREEPDLPADFASFLLSLAAGAQAGLGIAPHPVTGKREIHLGQAKYSIDLLGLLQEKTQGNLSPEEGQLLEALLYDLRMRYVEAKQAKS